VTVPVQLVSGEDIRPASGREDASRLARPRTAPALVPVLSAEHVRELTVTECAVLGLLCARATHGWAIAQALRAEGELGVLWTAPRPSVYRALELLAEDGLIAVAGIERGTRGPRRTVFAATQAGRLRFERWLTEPVSQAQELQPVFFLKLTLAERGGTDAWPIIASQRAELAACVGVLERQLPPGGIGGDLHRFQLESTRVALAFVESLAARRAAPAVAN
jgi:DNA-binding PadR family transcriptional regulator